MRMHDPAALRPVFGVFAANALTLAFALALAMLPGAAQAQQAAAAPTCPAPLPPAFAAWSNATALDSASEQPGLAMTQIAPGEAENLTLHPAREVHFLRPPAQPAAPGSFAGMVGVHVTAAGTYRVALSGPAWIDLLAHGAPLPATAHGHGPDCSGIRKIVDFALQPGDYVLQVSGSAAQTVTVLVAPRTDNMPM